MVFACAPSVGSAANAKAATALRRPSTTAGGAVIESWRPRFDVAECGASVDCGEKATAVQASVASMVGESEHRREARRVTKVHQRQGTKMGAFFQLGALTRTLC